VGPTKTGASRTVAIPATVAEDLARHFESVPDGRLVFPAPMGGYLARTRFRTRTWLPAVAAAGIDPPPGFHDLRHTAAALAIAEGAHPKAIQARLGHACIRTTLDVYGGLFPTLDADLADRLDRLAAKRLRNVCGTKRQTRSFRSLAPQSSL
jgi:integrase